MALQLKNKRSWQPREMQMLQEYLVRSYPRDRWATRVRLGSPTPTRPTEEMTPEERAAVGGWRRWADAVVFLEDRLILIEAAIRPVPGKIAQLELYRMLVPHTPELQRHIARPIELVLLYAVEDPATTYMARQRGIRAIEYKPSWLPAYLELLYPRERRGSQFVPP